MSEALKALLDYSQADEDGVMVWTSRQAIHEVAGEFESLRRELAEARAWIAAVMECAGDTWECSRCGHSEPWWEGSNAEYSTGEREKRLSALAEPKGVPK